MSIKIELTEEQIEKIRRILTHANNLPTDERQLLNGLLEMAQNHPKSEDEHAWGFYMVH
jgi:hypothetical protein